MKKVVFLLVVATLGFGGCTVAEVSQRGTRVEESFTPANTAAEIRAVLGKANVSVAFARPLMASTVPELRGAFAHYGRNIEDRLLWGYEDYTFVGWVYDPSEWEGSSMGPIGGQVAHFPIEAGYSDPALQFPLTHATARFCERVAQ